MVSLCKRVISFTSEDSKNCSDNILDAGNLLSYWVCGMSDCHNSHQEIELQLAERTRITHIDIGNMGSAFVEIHVSSSAVTTTAAASTTGGWCCLIAKVSMMSVADAKSWTNLSQVKMFTRQDMTADAVNRCWDRVRITCSQPFQRGRQYGLAFCRVLSLDGGGGDKENIPESSGPNDSIMSPPRQSQMKARDSSLTASRGERLVALAGGGASPRRRLVGGSAGTPTKRERLMAQFNTSFDSGRSDVDQASNHADDALSVERPAQAKCPMCQGYFPSSTIDAHAWQCDGLAEDIVEMTSPLRGQGRGGASGRSRLGDVVTGVASRVVTGNGSPGNNGTTSRVVTGSGSPGNNRTTSRVVTGNASLGNNGTTSRSVTGSAFLGNNGTTSRGVTGSAFPGHNSTTSRIVGGSAVPGNSYATSRVVTGRASPGNNAPRSRAVTNTTASPGITSSASPRGFTNNEASRLSSWGRSPQRDNDRLGRSINTGSRRGHCTGDTSRPPPFVNRGAAGLSAVMPVAAGDCGQAGRRSGMECADNLDSGPDADDPDAIVSETECPVCGRFVAQHSLVSHVTACAERSFGD